MVRAVFGVGAPVFFMGRVRSTAIWLDGPTETKAHARAWGWKRGWGRRRLARGWGREPCSRALVRSMVIGIITPSDQRAHPPHKTSNAKPAPTLSFSTTFFIIIIIIIIFFGKKKSFQLFQLLLSKRTKHKTPKENAKEN